MTKIKLCGLTKPLDILAANRIRPDFIGFVFAKASRRYVTEEQAAALKKLLSPDIRTVGVFVDEKPETVAALQNRGIIDLAQLHGDEDGDYLRRLRELTDRPIIRAFRIRTAADVKAAETTAADFLLFDSGAGTGRPFDWSVLETAARPYFLAGGLSPENVEDAVRTLKPYAVDVSSGIETEGQKDEHKMTAFADAVRKGDGL